MEEPSDGFTGSPIKSAPLNDVNRLAIIPQDTITYNACSVDEMGEMHGDARRVSMYRQRDPSTRPEADIPELSAVVGCVYSRFHEYWPVLAGHAGTNTRSKRSE